MVERGELVEGGFVEYTRAVKVDRQAEAWGAKGVYAHFHLHPRKVVAAQAPCCCLYPHYGLAPDEAGDGEMGDFSVTKTRTLGTAWLLPAYSFGCFSPYPTGPVPPTCRISDWGGPRRTL